MLGQSLVLRQEQVQGQILTEEQRVTIGSQRLELRLSLIHSLRGEQYTSEGCCPRCKTKLTTIEILKGFNRDSNDFTTYCVTCGTRFEPKLIYASQYASTSIPFYCDIQTLDQLRGKELLSPDELSVKCSGVFRSAVFHFGGVKKAFELMGIKYGFEEITDWKVKIKPFLGLLPDTEIADNVGVNVAAIRYIRRKSNIPRYTMAVTLSKMEDEV